MKNHFFSRQSNPYYLFTLILLLFPSLAMAMDTAKDWRFSKEQEGVVVLERIRPNTGYKDFRAEVIVNARPDQVVRTFQDLEKISQWHYQTHSVEVLELVSMTQAYLYIVSNPPWPMQSRDVVAYVDLQHDPSTGQIKMRLQGVANKQVPKSEHTRVPKLEAEWNVSPVGKDKSRVLYQLYSEPGGELPRWMFNSVAMDVPLYTLINLRQYFSKLSKSEKTSSRK